MPDSVHPRKVPMWEFFNERPDAAAPITLGRLEELDSNCRTVAWLFVEALRGTRRVLDVGCGTGLPALHVAAHVQEVVAVDAAPNMVEAAQANAARLGLNNVSFEVLDSERLPFNRSEFDGASLCGVLESVDWEGVHRMMQEVRRVLKHGGRIAVFDQDWLDVLRRKPRREARIQKRLGRLMLEILEREDAPGLERHARYLVDSDSPSGHKLIGELGESARMNTRIELRDLRQEDILDAWYDEGAQFNEETLAELAGSYDFSEIAVQCPSVWNERVLFLTARRQA